MSADEKEPYFDGPHMSNTGHFPPSNMQENEFQPPYNVPVMYNQQGPGLNDLQDNHFPAMPVSQQQEFYDHNHLEDYQANPLDQQEHKLNALQMQHPQEFEVVSSSENSVMTNQQSSSNNNSLSTSSHQNSPQRTVESYPSNLIQQEELTSQTERNLPNSFQDLASSSNMLPSTSANFSNSDSPAQYMAPAESIETSEHDIPYDPTVVSQGIPEVMGQNHLFGSYMNMANNNSAQLSYHPNYGRPPEEVGHFDASSSHLHPSNERREYDGLHSQGTWAPISTTSASTSEWNLVENNQQQPPPLQDNSLQNEIFNQENMEDPDIPQLQHSESFEVLNVVTSEMENLNLFVPDSTLEGTGDQTNNKNAPNNLVLESSSQYMKSNEQNYQQQVFETNQLDSGNYNAEFLKENAETPTTSNFQPEIPTNQDLESTEKLAEPTVKQSDVKIKTSRTNSVSSLQGRRNSNSSTKSGVSQRSAPAVVLDPENFPEIVQQPDNEEINMIETHTMHSSYVSVEPRPVDTSNSLKANTSYHQPTYSGPTNNNLHSQMAVTSAPPARVVSTAPTTGNDYNQSYSDMHASLHPYSEDRNSGDPKDNPPLSLVSSTSELKFSEQEINQPPKPPVLEPLGNIHQNKSAVSDQNQSYTNPSTVATTFSTGLESSGVSKQPPLSEPVPTNYLGNAQPNIEVNQTNANSIHTNSQPVSNQVPIPVIQGPVSSGSGYSQTNNSQQPPLFLQQQIDHPAGLQHSTGFEQNPQIVGQTSHSSQSNVYVPKLPADANPNLLSGDRPTNNQGEPSLAPVHSNNEPGYLSQTTSQQPPQHNQQVPDKNYHHAQHARGQSEPTTNYQHSAPTISSHQRPYEGQYHSQQYVSGQPDGYPPSSSDHAHHNLHAPSQNRGSQNQPEPVSHPQTSGYGPSYYQNTSYQRENVERVSSRPPSRSSITGETSYVPYHERSEYDQYNYHRPRSRQGYEYDPRYSGRYNNEYDDYYRARKEDYYNRGYRRDYYQNQGDYYNKYGAYYDQRYYYDRRASDQYGRYHQDQYYNQRGYGDWRNHQSQQQYDPRYYDNQNRSSKVDSYNTSTAQNQSSYADNNYDESLQQGYQYKGEHTLEDTTSYPNTFDEETWENLPKVPDRRTPAKFNSAHPILRFGAGGYLIHVLPNSPVDGKPATVEMLSVETLLEETPEAEEFRSYPGPLSRKETHKIDVVSFTTQQSNQSQRRTDLIDRDSVALTWDFLSVLVRQNGTIMGTDVAELLMRDHSGNFDLMQSPNDMQRRPPQISSGSNMEVVPANQNDEANMNNEDSSTVRFRDLLLYGRKKDALEWAMKSNLWGHALLLASKTDARTHANVMLRFANSLPINDPLQTLYQLMSGRQPAATTCIAEEGWGDWRPHLAMMLSNATDSITLDTKVVMTLGDTLLSKDLLDAAHFCYLMATSPLGYYSKKSGKLVLIGSNHTLPFYQFATNEGIRRSECYEYALALGHATNKTKMEFMPALQIYKLIYAGRLMELGLVEKAFHYCENIAKVVCKSPSLYSTTLVSQLVEMINIMQYHDPRVQAGAQLSSDLRWIQSLLLVSERMGKSSLGSLPPSTISPSMMSSVTSQLDSASSEEDDEDVEEIREDPSSHGMVQNNYQRPDQNQPVEEVQLDGQHFNTYGPPPTIEPTFYQPKQMGDLMQKSNPLQQQQFQQQQPPSGFEQQQESSQQQQFQQPREQNNLQQQQFQPQQEQNNFQQQQFQQQQSNQAPPLFQPPQQNNFEQHNYQQPQFYQNQQQPPFPISNENYDQVPAMPSLDVVSRVRTTSQTSHQSHASHTSHRSRKSSGRRSRTVSENSHRSRSRSTSAESIKKEKAAEKEKKGWGFMNWFSKKKVNQVHLPDDSVKELVWDPVKKRWTNGEEEEEEVLAPPPMVATSASVPDAPMPSSGGMTRNQFSLKSLNNKSMYKDAFGGKTSSNSNQNIVPPALFPSIPTQNNNPSVFIPKPVPTSAPSETVNHDNQKITENQQNMKQHEQSQYQQSNFQQQPFNPQQQQTPFQPQQNNQQQFQPQQSFQPQQNNPTSNNQQQFQQQDYVQQQKPQQHFQPQINDNTVQQPQQFQPQKNSFQQQPFEPQQQPLNVQQQQHLQQSNQPPQLQAQPQDIGMQQNANHQPPNQVNNPPSNPIPAQAVQNTSSDPPTAPPGPPMTAFYNPSQFDAGQNRNPFAQPTAPTRGGFSSRRARGRGYPKVAGS